MDELIDQIHGSARRPASSGSTCRRDRAGLQQRRLREGVPIEESVMAELDDLTRTLGA